jgi:glycosyltransferase involved in cell wall biosynthesis
LSEQRKLRIGWFSDWVCATTGFATVARNVLSRLVKAPDFEIIQLAYGFDAFTNIDNLKLTGESKMKLIEEVRKMKHPWQLELPGPYGFPAFPVPNEQDYGQSYLLEWCEQFKIDVLILNFDPWMTSWLPAQGLEEKFPCPIIYYQPVDGYTGKGELPRQRYKEPSGRMVAVAWEDIILAQNHTVFYGDWARDLILSNLSDEEKKQFSGRYSVINHGVDLSLYQPFPKSAFKRLFGIDKDAFVVGMVGTNQPRKNWPGIARVVGKLMDEYDNIYFIPWTRFNVESTESWDLDQLFSSFCNKERVFRHKGFQEGEMLVPEFMARLYAAMDVHVLWHKGEGCGLPHLEAQACGRPSLAVDYSGIVDYFSDDWLRVPWSFMTYSTGNCMGRPEGNEAILYKKLKALIEDRGRLGVLGKKARKYAEANWNWNGIALQWDTLIREVRVKWEKTNHERISASS